MIILYAYAFLLVFYTLYIAAINLYRDWSYLPLWLKLLSWPIPVVMVIFFDIPVNLTIGSLFFLDMPEEFTLSDRLARYRTSGTAPGWRKTVATVICTQALNPFDPTKHHC